MLFTFIAGEIITRLAGYRPWINEPLQVTIEPGKKLYVIDSLTGFNTFPGIFRISLPSGLAFTMTHDTMNGRITIKRPSSDPLPEIWFIGCSYTHGWGLSD